MEKKRSKGVTFWGIVMIINALLAIIIYLLKSPILLKDSITTLKLNVFQKDSFTVITFNALYIVFAICVLLLKEWARKTIVILCTLSAALGLLSGLLTLNSIMKSLTMMSLIGYYLAINIGELIFFTRPKVKEQFK